MPANRRLILASNSPRRRKLLAEMGVEFVVDPAHVDETPPPGLAPAQVAVELARRKARKVGFRHESAFVLGADTVVALGSEVIGKPMDRAEAISILARLSGLEHAVITGVCLIDTSTGAEVADSVVTWVDMKPMSKRDIEDYVDSGEAYGKAGAYAIQETGDRFVERLKGSFSNVVGLPVERLREMMEGFLNR